MRSLEEEARQENAEKPKIKEAKKNNNKCLQLPLLTPYSSIMPASVAAVQTQSYDSVMPPHGEGIDAACAAAHWSQAPPRPTPRK